MMDIICIHIYLSIYLSFFLSFYVYIYISKKSFNNQKQYKIDPFGIKAAKFGWSYPRIGIEIWPKHGDV